MCIYLRYCIYVYIYIYVYIIPICSGHISVILALFLLLFIFGKVQRLGAITASQERRRLRQGYGHRVWTSASYFHDPVDLEWVVGGGINSLFADFTSMTLVKHVTYHVLHTTWGMVYYIPPKLTDSNPAKHFFDPQDLVPIVEDQKNPVFT